MECQTAQRTFGSNHVGCRSRHHLCTVPAYNPQNRIPSPTFLAARAFPVKDVGHSQSRGRRRAVWVVSFETGRVLAFVMFEAGPGINDGAIHPELYVVI